MLEKVKIAVVVSGLLFLGGCDSVNQQADANKALTTQGEQLVALSQEVDSLKAQLTEAKKKQASLELNNMFRDWEKIAFLRPGDSGYSPVRFDLGVLTVEMADVKPYANGSKINLRFGNTLSSSINGLKVTLDWGRVDEKGVVDNETAKSKEFTFTETLRSGAWTTIPVVLDGLPPTELGFVRVKDVAHTGISLN